MWKAALAGTATDLERLARVYREADPTVSCDDAEAPRWWLASTSFDSELTPVEIWPLAVNLLTLLNGIAIVRHGHFRPVRLSGNYLDENGIETLLVTPGSAVVRVTAEAVAEVSGVPVASVEREWLALAETNPAVRDALSILGAGVAEDFGNPYKVMELVRGDVGGDPGIVRRRWATKRQLSAFDAAANNAALSGQLARHPEDYRDRRPSIPKRGLELDEADEMVRRIVSLWLTEKTRPSTVAEERPATESDKKATGSVADALGHLIVWTVALDRQAARIEAANEVDDGTWFRAYMEIDARFFVTALRNLLRSVDLVKQRAPVLARSQIGNAIAKFHAEVPGARRVRDRLEHFDRYEEGTGYEQEDADASEPSVTWTRASPGSYVLVVDLPDVRGAVAEVEIEGARAAADRLRRAVEVALS